MESSAKRVFISGVVKSDATGRRRVFFSNMFIELAREEEEENHSFRTIYDIIFFTNFRLIIYFLRRRGGTHTVV